jgi:hypothetical protein
MCTGLVIKYDCGHESKNNLLCSKRQCKQTDEHERKKHYFCRDCNTAEMARFRQECEDAIQDAKEEEAASAHKSEHIKMLADEIARTKQEKTEYKRALRKHIKISGKQKGRKRKP